MVMVVRVPAPVGVDDNLAIDIGAACSALTRALLPDELGVNLSLLRANDPGGGA